MRPVAPAALLALLLPACTWVGDDRYFTEVQDADGDGVLDERFGGPDCDDHDPGVGRCDRDRDGAADLASGGDDCDDRDPRVRPGAPETCDGRDEDCDGLVDDRDPELVGAATWHRDADGDDHGDPAPAAAVVACEAPEGWVADALDCDDADADVKPGAAEFCGPVDENCDGDPESGAVDRVEWVEDGDRDGWAPADGAVVSTGCAPEQAHTLPLPAEGDPSDCDDADPDVFPGATEVFYDGIDADCAGDSDEDADGDGADRLDDCDDADPDRHPGAAERCDGVDDDCDLLVDDADPDVGGVLVTWYPDLDGDGRAALGGAPRAFCPTTVPAGHALVADDCRDDDPTVNPLAPERCDGLDQNCNGTLDDNPVDDHAWFLDADQDGHGVPTQLVFACDAPAGWVASFDDCDDADVDTHPGAPEVCGDAVRQDCRALPPEDCDGDGTVDGGDCDPADPAVGPGLPEICDGKDNDCDRAIDLADGDLDRSTTTDWFRDADLDTFGDPTVVQLGVCTPPGAGWVTDARDCDDASAARHPGAPEHCDTLDNDCDGFADDADPDGWIDDAPTWYRDLDGDGAGEDATASTGTCDPPDPLGWVVVGGDCDDTDLGVGPTAPETCAAGDEDCDGLEGDADPDVVGLVWFVDADDDGFGLAGSTLASCAQPANGASVAGDCDDSASGRNPGASEVCNGGIDDDCDGASDEADPSLQGSITVYADLDGDGYGDLASPASICGAAPGYVANALDCDDLDAGRSPGAVEVCNGLDDDCDTVVDAGARLVGLTLFADTDGDGFGDRDAPILTSCAPGPGAVVDATDCDDADARVFPGQTLRIPGDRPTLEAAVADACDGGTLLLVGAVPRVTSGMTLAGKALTIRGPSASAPVTLQIDPGIADPLLTLDATTPDGTTVENVMFEIGNPNQPFFSVTDSSLTLRGVEGTPRLAGSLVGSVAVVNRGVLVVEDSTFDDVTSGALFAAQSSVVSLDGCDFADNVSSPAGPAILETTDSDVFVSDVSIVRTQGSMGVIRVHGGTFSVDGLWLEDDNAFTTALLVDGALRSDARLEDVTARRTGTLTFDTTLNNVYLLRSRFEESTNTEAVKVQGGRATLGWVEFLDATGHAVSTAGTTSIASCTFVEAGQPLISVTGGAATVTNSVLWRSGGSDTLSVTGGTFAGSHNLHHLSDPSNVGAPDRTADGSVPLFQTASPDAPVRAWDVHPAGISHPGPLEDFDVAFQERDGTAWDIGAFSGPRFEVWYDQIVDGMGDGWAVYWFGSVPSGTGDLDGDGADNATEWENGTDPTNPDTDEDGVLDGADGPLH